MGKVIPNELQIAFNSPKFQELVYAKTTMFGLDKRPFFQMYNEEEIINLVKAYIVYTYNGMTNETLKLRYPGTLTDEIAVSFICSTFLGLCQEAFKEDSEIREEARKDFDDLNKLRDLREKEAFKNLDSLNLPICNVIESGYCLGDYDFDKLNVNEIVQLTKCVIIRESSSLTDIYDKIDMFRKEEAWLAGFIRLATDAYIKGTTTEDARKEKREKAYNVFVDINIINMGMGHTREIEE